ARYKLDPCYADITLVACSSAAARDLSSLAKVPIEAVTVIHSVVDVEGVRAAGAAVPSSAARRASEVVIGACGVANERKGIDLWIDVVARVRRRLPDHHLRFVWVGHYDGALIGLANAAEVADIVDLTGELDNPLPEVACFDVFTLPSRADPFPLAVLEAMAL